MNGTSGIHHITAITGDPQRCLDFYEGFLGQKLVKRTVNFDDPRSYHFYFGDAAGTPGTLLTFFYFGAIRRGTRGVGEVSRISYRVARAQKDFWVRRAATYGIPCSTFSNDFDPEILTLTDPDGITIDLVFDDIVPMTAWNASTVPPEAMLLGFHSATLMSENTEEMLPALNALGYTLSATSGQHSRFVAQGTHAQILDCIEAPDVTTAEQGTGSVHHIAFRASTDDDELAMRARIEEIGESPTPVIDRQYFQSVYFRTKSNILFEIATDAPGFAIDEKLSELGETLVLPPQFEPHRAEITRNLVPITLPRHRT